MKKVLVVGGGRVGSVIARDLSVQYDVVVSDVNDEVLHSLNKNYGLKTVNLRPENKIDFIDYTKGFDLIVNALPGFLGFSALKTIIEAKKDVVDISFFSEDPYLLDELAKKNGVCAIIDCGVAPGLCNIFLGHHLKENVQSYACYVGGLPFEKTPPYNYKAPFSPIDVIEEYTRPARLRINGEEVIREALTEIETVEVKEVGSLEAFNTDGLRSLLRTTAIPNLKEKTLRYPGHAKLMQHLKDVGFFDANEISVGSEKVIPLELTSELLFKQWKLNDEDDEFTFMMVQIESENSTIEYRLFDRKDFKNNMSSMARTTGFTCAAACRLILEGTYHEAGIIAPEILGRTEENFESILMDLKNRGIQIEIKENRH